MIVLIDGDILVYRTGYASNDSPVGIACSRIDSTIESILRSCGTTYYHCYLTGQDRSNFRFDLYSDYKGNRKQPKPVWYLELREHLIHEHSAEVVFGREADDAMADAQTDDTIIASIDKDLDQVPGKHYDFVKGVHYDISCERGTRFFYYQLLTGDRTDNVPGVKGIGPKRAESILGAASSEPEWLQLVVDQYQQVYGGRGHSLLMQYGKCLKIGGSIWDGGLLNKENTDLDLKEKQDQFLSPLDSSTKQPS